MQGSSVVDKDLLKAHNISESEYQRIVQLLGRDPNINELGMFSVMWSEHCSYKHSKHLLRKFPTQNEYVLQGPGENAGVIKLTDDISIAFKIESHNHPTAVEPFQGATTGVGGILRDIFTMGARPIANLNSLRFGDLTRPQNRYLFAGAVAGIAHYGNCVGVPTIAGECYFDDSYTGNPLVNAMAIGVLYNQEVIKSGAEGIGNPVLYVGSSTGRDGMGGASFASKSLAEKSQDDRPAVQVGDPFQEKLLIEACLEAFATGYIVAAQDMGAAGLTCSTCEMASKGNVGITIDLNKVPVREKDMTPYEYLLSESQERMLLVVQRGHEDDMMTIFKKWGLHAVLIGEVTSTGKVTIYFNDTVVVDIPAKALTEDIPTYTENIAKNFVYPATPFDASLLPDITLENVIPTLKELLGSPNICSKQYIYRQYDRQVQNATLRSSSQQTAGIIRIRRQDGKFLDKALAVTVDCNSRYVKLNPYEGAKLAVYEAALNLACTGAKPVAITNNLNFGSPDNAEIYYQLDQATSGIADACRSINTPVTGGNVSLYNESGGKYIDPTPVIGMVGILDDLQCILPQHFIAENLSIFLVGASSPLLDGSEYLKLKTGQKGGYIPPVDDLAVKKMLECLQYFAQERLVISANDISEGGLLACLAECMFLNQVGCELESFVLSLTERIDASLFGEFGKRVLLTIQPDCVGPVTEILRHNHLEYTILGETGGKTFSINKTPLCVDIHELKNIWESSLDHMLKAG